MPVSVGSGANNIGNETLATTLAVLQDMLTELDGKLEAGELVGLEADTIAQLQAVTATIVNLPTDYPDTGTHTKLDSIITDLTGIALAAKQDTGNTSIASLDTKTPSLGQALSAASRPVVLPASQITALTPSNPTDFPSTGANTKLDQLHTDNGTVGATPPTIPGTGVIGYLRAIYDKAASILSDMGGLNQINGVNVDVNSGNKSSGTMRVVLASDQPIVAVADSHVTDGTQQTKITDGTNTAGVSTNADINALSAVVASKTQVYSSASGDLTIDVSGYRYFSMQHGATVGTTQPQWSNDGVTWFALPFVTNLATFPASWTGGAGVVAGATGGGNLPGRYFRMHNTVGTYSGVVFFGTETIASAPMTVQAVQSGTYTVLQGIQGTSAWLTGGTASTVSNNASTTAATGSTVSATAAQSYWGMQVIVGGTGSLSALTVVLEGSNDGGTTWFQLASYGTASSGFIANTSAMPCLSVRSRITTITAASGTPTVTTRVAGGA